MIKPLFGYPPIKGVYQAVYGFARETADVKEYIMYNLTDGDGNVVAHEFSVEHAKCFKYKNFKRGDILRLTATLERMPDKSVRVFNPIKVNKIGHNSSYDK